MAAGGECGHALGGESCWEEHCDFNEAHGTLPSSRGFGGDLLQERGQQGPRCRTPARRLPGSCRQPVPVVVVALRRLEGHALGAGPAAAG